MPEDRETPEQKKSPIVQLANYSQLAFIFPAATVVGWLIGLALDRWLHTTWLYLAGLILGIIAGFVELIRLVMSSESKSGPD
ncbi:MAG: AtpZ/AtpI family protein [Terriglobales bacterium]